MTEEWEQVRAEIRSVLQDAEGLSAREVARAIGCDHDTALGHLEAMEWLGQVRVIDEASETYGLPSTTEEPEPQPAVETPQTSAIIHRVPILGKRIERHADGILIRKPPGRIER